MVDERIPADTSDEVASVVEANTMKEGVEAIAEETVTSEAVENESLDEAEPATWDTDLP